MFTSSFTDIVHDANRLPAIFLHGIFVVVLFRVIRVIILFHKISVDLMLCFLNLTQQSNVEPSTQTFHSLTLFLQIYNQQNPVDGFIKLCFLRKQ